MNTPDAWQHAFHLTVPDHWLNDPQRPVYSQGAYQYFYLYNGDFPEPTGTSWRRVSTTDGVRFQDHGVAMDKWSQPNRDLWSGCLVVDEDGTAGLGEGAVVALVTQLDRASGADAQAQFLWYSTDGGVTFTNLSDTPVLANRGYEHFRDPKVVRVDDSWVMVLAEDTDLGFYASQDLRSWQEVSRFHEDRIGMLECPDLFRITADDGTAHWVLAASPQHSVPGRADRPGTYAYWVGDFDGTRFTPTVGEPRWLDFGFDWYAAVTWPVHDQDGRETSDRRWAIGWMNNWAYATQDPPTWTDAGYHGIDSVVRELTLARTDDGYVLVSRPLHELATVRTPVPVGPGVQRAPAAASVTARVCPGARVRVKVSEDGTRGVDVLVTATEILVDRSSQGCPGDGALAVARAPWRGGPVDLEILVDRATVEVYADGGRIALSMLTFAAADDTGIELVEGDGSIRDAAVAEVRATALEAATGRQDVR
ncbi:glycoside hydrolase family 32 protein [Cellulomonas sp. Sa3CUA2]|uniref:Glycoside hydrolase family 32 protein n=1 Tax=Cellulomonas avistercoris TaxID=2762242 RepID=A0ABR8QFD8_9CELL|nr:glycoside hydrolase family 32 protein [Cellulomonas avistercoris]MBD7919138.1 glycoside hydrolase family 32 protein [Cellulomonas avistercoris]